jgi:hypothetical protein
MQKWKRDGMSEITIKKEKCVRARLGLGGVWEKVR